MSPCFAKYAKWFRPVFPLRFLALVPLSHMFGQAMALFIVPFIPGVVCFMRGYSPHEIAQQIRTRRVSVVIVVPKLLEVLQEYVLRQFQETADPCRPDAPLVHRWRRYHRVHRHCGWRFWAFVSGAAPLEAELVNF